ncbi:MAG: hypothetical protein EBE86_022505 [Hormoscilla sp. GUM202]|nr:hypothetical protein [Hormoscilla sp. GUM202]
MLIRQLDEMWSFVGNKQKKQWLWLALDELTREIVGVYVGDSSAQSAKKHGLHAPIVSRDTHPCRCLLANDMVGEEETTPSAAQCAIGNSLPPVARQCAVCYTDITRCATFYGRITVWWSGCIPVWQ